MIRKIKTLLVSLTLLFSFGSVLIPATAAAADPADDACAGLNAAGVQCTTNQSQANSGFGDVVQTVINVLSVIVGAASVIMIIVGGFRYIISGGDSTGVQGAKNTILYAVIGLVVVLFAQVIVRFVWTQAKP